MNTSKKPPLVFLSYTWDSTEHEKWVLDLANSLILDGINVILDKFDLRLGDDILYFMEQSVEKSDKTILIFTERYKRKATQRKGGAGYEYSLISADIYQKNRKSNKFIPLLRQGDISKSVPSYFKPKYYLDMRKDENFSSSYQRLIYELYNSPIIKKPTIGKTPVFINEDSYIKDDFIYEKKIYSWIVNIILNDQYTELDNDANGAWSKRYPNYMQFSYGNKLPLDASIKDTITLSTWILESLYNSLNKILWDNQTKSQINIAIGKYKSYLLRHFNYKDGGFGLPSRVKITGEYDISVDLRHSIWATLALLKFEEITPDIRNILLKLSKYFENQINLILENSINERAITLAAFHKLICNDKFDSIVLLDLQFKRRLQKDIESKIVQKFNLVSKSWDTEGDDIYKTRTIMNLFTIYSMDINKIIDPDLNTIIKTILQNISQSAISVNQNSIGISICEDNKPDWGISIQFVSIISNYKKKIITIDTLNKFFKYIFHDNHFTNLQTHNYPWHLAQIFNINKI